ncbi:MAG: F0F1 ATP synthase subunit delta [Chitinophagales bacterium]
MVEKWRRSAEAKGRFRTIRRPVGAGGARPREGEPLKALVKTAQPLTPELTEYLRGRLQEMVHRTVEVVNEVDPAVLAGMVVQIGSRMVDLSLQGQLSQLERRIERALSNHVRSLKAWDVSVDELMQRARS